MSFNRPALRRKPSEHRHPQPISGVEFEICRTENIPPRLLSHDRRQFILGRKRREHLGRAVCPLVYEEHDPPVERLWSEALRQEHDRLVTKRVVAKGGNKPQSAGG